MTIALAVDRDELNSQAAFMLALAPVLTDAYRLARAMLGSASDAEDAVQEAALNAWRHRRRFRPGSSFRPWFLTIVANQCRSNRRSRWSSVLRHHDVTSLLPSVPILEDPRIETLREALQHLDEASRLVLVLRYYLDLEFDDIARVLRVSEKGARSRVHRARERLRREMELER